MDAAEARRTTFQFNEDDLVAAARLHVWTALTTWKTLLFLVIVVIGAGLIVSTLLSESGTPDVSGTVATAAVGVPAVLAILHYMSLPQNARRMHRQQKSLQESLAVEWSDDGMNWDGQTGHSRTPWSHYVKWCEDRRLFLLYHSDRLHQILPKRVLSSADIDSIRSNLVQAGVPQFRRFG
ncbi:MAG TPA: YcxB family protein [Inquilinus sp.]